MDIKFVEYKLTPGEKHLGIVTIDFDGIIMLRYRISPGKEGNGIFPSPASYKVVENGQDRYVPSFEIDSSTLHKRIVRIIMDGIEAHSQPKSQIQESASILDQYADCPF